MRCALLFLIGFFALGCATKDDEAATPPGSFGGDDGDAGPCADYRSSYPEGPYGFSVGDVLDDFPGMVDGSGAAQSLVDIFSDRTKMVLVIANAFET